MIIYLILLVALCIAAAFEINKKQVVHISWVNHIVSVNKDACVPVLLLLFLGVFRETTVGFDALQYYYNYWNRVDFYTWRQLFSDFSTDNGFNLTLKALSLFTENWWFARAVLFLITFLLCYAVVRKETPYPSLSLIVLLGLDLLSLMFGILRQALAMSVSMYAYKQIRKGSWFKCLLLILTASTIHKSALICVFMLLLFLLRTKKFSGAKLIVLSGVTYGLFFAVIPLITLFYEDSRYEGVAESNGGYGKLLFMVLVIALIAYLFYITDSHKDEEASFLFNLSCGALLVQVGALQWSLLTRISVYFSIYWCILLPKLISKLPQKKRIQYCLVVMVLFGVMFLYGFSDVDMFVMHQF